MTSSLWVLANYSIIIGCFIAETGKMECLVAGAKYFLHRKVVYEVIMANGKMEWQLDQGLYIFGTMINF